MTIISIWQRLSIMAEKDFHEAFRLKRYESKLRLADQIWAVSKEDKSHLESTLGHSNVHFLPSFKGFDNVSKQEKENMCFIMLI